MFGNSTSIKSLCFNISATFLMDGIHIPYRMLKMCYIALIPFLSFLFCFDFGVSCDLLDLCSQISCQYTILFSFIHYFLVRGSLSHLSRNIRRSSKNAINLILPQTCLPSDAHHCLGQIEL